MRGLISGLSNKHKGVPYRNKPEMLKVNCMLNLVDFREYQACDT
jgi:hypothetical protein